MWTTLWISLKQISTLMSRCDFSPDCLFFRHCVYDVYTTKSMVRKTLAWGYVEVIAEALIEKTS